MAGKFHDLCKKLADDACCKQFLIPMVIFVVSEAFQFRESSFQTQLSLDSEWAPISNKISKVYLWKGYCQALGNSNPVESAGNSSASEKKEVDSIDPVKRFENLLNINGKGNLVKEKDKDKEKEKEKEKGYCMSVNEARTYFKSWLLRCINAEKAGLISDERTLKRWQEKCYIFEREFMKYEGVFSTVETRETEEKDDPGAPQSAKMIESFEKNKNNKETDFAKELNEFKDKKHSFFFVRYLRNRFL